MVHLIDYKTVRTLDGVRPYKSTRLQQENDCGQAKARLVYMSVHSETMAGGVVVLSDAALERWEAVLPGTGREDRLEIRLREIVGRVAGCLRLYLTAFAYVGSNRPPYHPGVVALQ